MPVATLADLADCPVEASGDPSRRDIRRRTLMPRGPTDPEAGTCATACACPEESA